MTIFGTTRLAKPESWWARRFYDPRRSPARARASGRHGRASTSRLRRPRCSASHTGRRLGPPLLNHRAGTAGPGGCTPRRRGRHPRAEGARRAPLAAAAPARPPARPARRSSGLRRRLGHRRAQLNARGRPPGKPWDVDITVLQHGHTPFRGHHAVGSDPLRRCDPRVRGEAHGQARGVPRHGRLPDCRSLDLRRGRRLHGPVAHLPGSHDRERRRPPSCPRRGDGGIAAGWLWGAGAALCSHSRCSGWIAGATRVPLMPQTPEPAA